MRYYEISMNGQVGHCPCSDVLPVEGQVLKVRRPFKTLAGRVYLAGHELRLIHRTDAAPHGRLSSLGNWLVDCGYMVSVWTNIEWMIAEGALE